VPQPAVGDQAARLEVEDVALATGERQPTLARIVRPEGADVALPTVLWLDGDWALGGSEADKGMARQLAGAGIAVLLPYGARRSPLDEEGIHRVLSWIGHDGPRRGLDPEQIAIAGVGVGALIGAAAGLAARRGRPALQVLIVTGKAKGACRSDARSTVAFLADVLDASRPSDERHRGNTP
jgi:acetyl esterase/lipase